MKRNDENVIISLGEFTSLFTDPVGLSDEDLDKVTGGGSCSAFEIKDFSFGVENPT